MMKEKRKTWPDHLPVAQWSHRTAQRPSTTASPCTLVYVELGVSSIRMALAVGWDPLHKLTDLEAIEERRGKAKVKLEKRQQTV
ncbi:hypothetical protein U1Q18_030386 [Sarracenia purpurea var. burkii]